MLHLNVLRCVCMFMSMCVHVYVCVHACVSVCTHSQLVKIDNNFRYTSNVINVNKIYPLVKKHSKCTKALFRTYFEGPTPYHIYPELATLPYFVSRFLSASIERIRHPPNTIANAKLTPNIINPSRTYVGITYTT